MVWRRGVLELPEFRLEVVKEALRPGANKSAVALRYGISRATLNRWIQRYEGAGEDGLMPWSRTPFRSPRQIPFDLEDDIFRMRKEHPRWGARRIAAELVRRGTDPPATSTIHQVLVRNGLLVPRAKKKKATKRFERERPHELWQIDATAVALSTNQVCWVMDIIDDCSRLLLAARVCPGPTGEAAVECFKEAAAAHGLPRQVLSDNGACFTGRLRRSEVAFERMLAALGVQQIHSRPMHPETVGKLERFHRTMKEWLIDHFPIETPAELQAALDRFKDHYNTERPHQAIGDRVPAEVVGALGALELAPKLLERQEGPVHPADAITRTVGKNGALTYNHRKISVGVRWSGHRLRIEPDGERVSIFYGDELVRSLVIDETKTFQPFRGQRTRSRR